MDFSGNPAAHGDGHGNGNRRGLRSARGRGDHDQRRPEGPDAHGHHGRRRDVRGRQTVRRHVCGHDDESERRRVRVRHADGRRRDGRAEGDSGSRLQRHPAAHGGDLGYGLAAGRGRRRAVAQRGRDDFRRSEGRGVPAGDQERRHVPRRQAARGRVLGRGHESRRRRVRVRRPPMRTVEVDLKETGNADFSVTLLRTVTATGMVSVEDFGPLEGVEVTISGGRNDLTHTATTDADGMYEVDRLYAGEYSVTMANPNDDEYGFDMPMVDGEEVDLRETLKADFSGILLRTAVIAGKVTVGEGTPLSGVTLTVSGGPKEESHDATTNAAGEYEVDRLHQGDYTVSLKDFNRVEYGFDPESVGGVMAVRKDTETVNFRGIYLRTAGVSGSVTVPRCGQRRRHGDAEHGGRGRPEHGDPGRPVRLRRAG